MMAISGYDTRSHFYIKIVLEIFVGGLSRHNRHFADDLPKYIYKQSIVALLFIKCSSSWNKFDLLSLLMYQYQQ